jgi:DNA-binding XRE family transcriptional regulator
MEPTPLRTARRAAELSQATLAAMAGISRQAVGAIEAGQHRPSVDAAMALAAAVDRSVEELFAAPARSPAVPVLGRPVPDGSGVLAARVGPRLVYAGAQDSLAFEGWPRPNAVMQDGLPRPLPGSDLDGFVLVGCDPALGLAAAMLPSTGPRRLIALSASTASALEAMRDGRAHGALVHGTTLPSPPAGVTRLHLARWRVGVANRGRRPRPVAEFARVVQRERGASSQKAFAAAIEAAGAQLPPGPVASGHLDAARRVAYGASAGVTMEPAAITMQLAFAPLEDHVAEIWVDARWRAHPGVDAIGDLLGSAAFTSRLGLVGGYELSECGNERS